MLVSLPILTVLRCIIFRCKLIDEHTSSIMQICLAVHKILADKAFITTDSLISIIHCHFCTSYICADSPYLELSSTT